MNPILYESRETDFNHNGLGKMNETLSAIVTEVANGEFELEVVYPIGGRLYKHIQDHMLIKAKPNSVDDPHVFRIYEHTIDTVGQTVTIYAHTKSNDLGQNLVKDVVINSLAPQEAMNTMKTNLVEPTEYSFVSDITTKSSTEWKNRNPLNCIAGEEGSLIHYWGGEIKRDNRTIYLYRRRGRDNVAIIRDGKNINGLSLEYSTKGMVTKIIPYRIYTPENSDDEVVEYGTPVESQYIGNYPLVYVRAIDYSNDDDVTSLQTMNTKASRYFTENNGVDKPSVNVSMGLVELSDSSEYEKFKDFENVELFDTVTVYSKQYDIHIEAKITTVEYDSLAGKNISLEMGSYRTGLIESTERTYMELIGEKEAKLVQTIQVAANGKNRVFRGVDEPTTGMVKNDLWYKPIGDGETEMYQFDGAYWQLILSTLDTTKVQREVEAALSEAEAAKQAVEQSYTDAVAEAERLVQAQTEVFNSQMSDVNDEISTVKTNIETDLTNVNQTIANNFTSLSDSISDVDDIATQAKTDAAGALGIVNNVNTTVNQLNGEVDTLITRVDGNDVLINQVTSTADGTKTTVANHAGRLSTVETNISGLQTTVADKVSNSQFTVLANSVSSVVTDLNNLQVGGRNYLRNSKGPITSTEYPIHTFELSQDIIPGETYTYQIKGTLKEGSSYWLFYDANGQPFGALLQHEQYDEEKDVYYQTFVATRTTSGIRIYSYPNTAGASATIEWVKLEKGNKATDWSPAPEDMATQSQITQLSTDINLRVAKGDVVSQLNIDAGRVLIQTNKLLLDTDTYIMGTTFANDVKAKSIEAVTANITSIRSQVLVADSVTSTHVKTEAALVNKIFATDAMVTTLTGKTAFINSIKAIDISADRITTGSLNAADVNIINLNASSIVGLNSNFVTSLWNTGAAGSVTISASGVVTQVGALATSLNAGHLYTIDGTKTGRVDANGMQIADSSNGQTTRLYSDGLEFNWYGIRRVLEQNSEGLTIRPISGSGNRLNSSLHLTTGPGAEKVAYIDFSNPSSGKGGRIILDGVDMGVRHPDGGVVRIANYANDGRLGELRVGTFQTTTYDGRGLQIVESQINTLAGNQTLYIMPSGTGELRIGSGGSNPVLWPVRASRFVEGSSRASKTNINPYVGSALDEIKHLNAVTFNRKEDVANGINYMSLGFIAEDSPFIAIQQPGAPLGVDHYKMVTLAIKGVQELTAITDRQASDMLRVDTYVTQHELEIKILKDRIKQLEENLA